MAAREIGKEVVRGLKEIKAWKKGKTKLRTTTVDSPRAADISTIRMKLRLSQDQFAQFMGVSVSTLRNWEKGRQELRGPARSLWFVVAKQPQAVREAFKSAMPVARLKAYRKQLKAR